MAEKSLICTRADQGIQEMCAITHPLLKEYAKRCGADFKILDHESPCQVGDGRWHYRIMKLRELLTEYDRVCHIDSDVLLTRYDIPNVFNVVPEDHIGTVLEDVGSRKKARRQVIQQIQDRFGNIGWVKGYPNTGMFIVSRRHREIFREINAHYWDGFGFDDAHLGYQIHKQNHAVKALGWKYNCMSMFCEAWNGSPSRYNAFAIHYAGRGIFDNRFKTKLDNMRHDCSVLFGGT